MYRFHDYDTLFCLHFVRLKFISVGAMLAWFCLGVTYGMLYEEFDLFTAVYFSLGAMMLSGSVSPPCIEEEGKPGCSLGTTRALFMSVYLIVGERNVVFTFHLITILYAIFSVNSSFYFC
jgi:hypothetical protein